MNVKYGTLKIMIFAGAVKQRRKMIQKIKKGQKYFLVVPGNIGATESQLWVDDICSKLGIVCGGYYFNKSVNQMQFIEVEE